MIVLMLGAIAGALFGLVAGADGFNWTVFAVFTSGGLVGFSALAAASFVVQPPRE